MLQKESLNNSIYECKPLAELKALLLTDLNDVEREILLHVLSKRTGSSVTIETDLPF